MKTIITILACLVLNLGLYAQNFELVVLDSSTNESGAYGVNAYGYAVGYKFVGGKATPYMWSANKGFGELSAPAGVTDSGIAYAINDRFEIVGTFGYYGTGGLNVYHIGSGKAVTWVFDLGQTNFIPYEIAEAPAMVRDISNNSEVVGQRSDFGFSRDVYNGDGYVSAMNYSYCFGVNDRGNIVGMFVSGASTSTYAPMYLRKETNGTYTMKSGASLFWGISSGIKINNSNQVVGSSGAGGFYWEPETGSNTVFGAGSTCYSINNAKVIVGTTNNHACMWKPNTDGSFTVVDLNSISSNTNVVLEKAFSINDKGQIVGQCLDTASGVRNAFMLTPAKGASVRIGHDNGELVLSWPSEANHNYTIKTSTDLVSWSSLPDIYLADGTNSWVRVNPDQSSMYFKVSDLTP